MMKTMDDETKALVVAAEAVAREMGARALASWLRRFATVEMAEHVERLKEIAAASDRAAYDHLDLRTVRSPSTGKEV